MAEVLLICKLFSATLFWVTKRPPKAGLHEGFHKGHKEEEEVIHLLNRIRLGNWLFIRASTYRRKLGNWEILFSRKAK